MTHMNQRSRFLYACSGLAAAVLLTCSQAGAQSFTGSISGTITDPSGAVVSGSRVTVIRLETNRKVSAVTGIDGIYLTTALSVGEYRVEVTARGFKQAVHTGLKLELNQAAVIDFRLEVGTSTELVQVTSDAPLLESTTSDLGKVVDNRRILDLPLNTRNVFTLINLTPGALGASTFRYDGQAWAVYGSRTNMNEIVVDGVTAVTPRPSGLSATSVFPSVDAIQEFRLIGMNPPAEFGRTSGAVLNIVFKSGGNQFHGSAFEFLRNSVLDSNDFFANSKGQPLASYKRNQFGGILTGPIRRNKTFFMVSYEGLRELKYASTTLSVPTALERTGDFSQTRASNGQLVQIFDPFSTVSTTSGSTRTQFPGNVIPPSEMDPVGVNLAKYFPMPNAAGAAFTNQNNYFASGANSTDIDNFDVRIDHNLTDRQRIFGRYSQRASHENPAEMFPQAVKAASGREIQGDKPHNSVFEYSNTLSPSTILTVRTGVARVIFDLANESTGFLASSLGLPKAIDQNADAQYFPEVPVAGYATLGGTHADVLHNTLNTFPLVIAFSRALSHHFIKAGFDGRLIRENDRETRDANGTFPFAAAMTQGPNPLKASSTAGNAVASLLLGTGTSNGSEIMYRGFKVQADQSYYLAWYLQDDWKVTRRLTLNLGLRYDFDTPKTERYNRLNWFDPTVVSPLAGKVPGFPNLPGGLQFAGVGGNGRGNFEFRPVQVGPRFGFAWQATPKTVVRGGYGHLYSASMVSATIADVPYGFDSETTWIMSLDGITPLNRVSNPYPAGISPSLGASQGLLSAVGQGFRSKEYYTPNSWNQEWNLTIQRTLPAGLFFEVATIGSRGRGMPYLYYPNELDPKYQALGSKLSQLVPNPFFGIVNNGIFASPTISQAQLLRPFPQFTDLTDAQNIGSDTWFNALQSTVKRRLDHGLEFEASYVWSKSIDRGEGYPQNHYRMDVERSVSSADIPHRFVASFLYEMPFGKGRYFLRQLPGPVEGMVGGWQFNGIVTMQSGTALGITASNTAGTFGNLEYANNNGKSGALSGRAEDRLNQWFNTSVFSQPDPYTYGNLSPRVADIRANGIENFDLSLFKEFRPTEWMKVQFRAEALNAFNHVQFAAPNTSVTSSSFGHVTAAANTPRQVQFGLKVMW
jgi:Carboxypeptidase regulatory-like domain/TonB dependent receptor